MKTWHTPLIGGVSKRHWEESDAASKQGVDQIHHGRGATITQSFTFYVSQTTAHTKIVAGDVLVGSE